MRFLGALLALLVPFSAMVGAATTAVSPGGVGVTIGEWVDAVATALAAAAAVIAAQTAKRALAAPAGQPPPADPDQHL